MYELSIITLEEYNYFHYGTKDPIELDLVYSGLPFYLVKIIKEDNQIKNILTDHFGNLSATNDFVVYLRTMPELFRFEVEKYLMNL